MYRTSFRERDHSLRGRCDVHPDRRRADTPLEARKNKGRTARAPTGRSADKKRTCRLGSYCKWTQRRPTRSSYRVASPFLRAIGRPRGDADPGYVFSYQQVDERNREEHARLCATNSYETSAAKHRDTGPCLHSAYRVYLENILYVTTNNTPSEQLATLRSQASG